MLPTWSLKLFQYSRPLLQHC